VERPGGGAVAIDAAACIHCEEGGEQEAAHHLLDGRAWQRQLLGGAQRVGQLAPERIEHWISHGETCVTTCASVDKGQRSPREHGLVAHALQPRLPMRLKTEEKVKTHNWGNPGYVKGNQRAGGGGRHGGGGKRSRFQGIHEKGDARRDGGEE
jgi:hypothetical protein